MVSVSMLKPQTQRSMMLKVLGSQRITVNDIDNITADELKTIRIPDARLQGLAGTDVSDPSQ